MSCLKKLTGISREGRVKANEDAVPEELAAGSGCARRVTEHETAASSPQGGFHPNGSWLGMGA